MNMDGEKLLDKLTEEVLSVLDDSIDNDLQKQGYIFWGDSKQVFKRSIRQKIKNKIRVLVEIIIGNIYIRPVENLEIDAGAIILETDLHGDMNAFLNTLFKNGMVELNGDNPTGIIFHDPNTGKTYTMEQLENSDAPIDMDTIQILPDLILQQDSANILILVIFLIGGNNPNKCSISLCFSVKDIERDSRMLPNGQYFW
ncbi:hypothetical protein FACS1894152_8280 [Bacilli bacterium]|nr:hypothetical protein FACS1894152_8280 [Bacilli bacterium]